MQQVLTSGTHSLFSSQPPLILQLKPTTTHNSRQLYSILNIAHYINIQKIQLLFYLLQPSSATMSRPQGKGISCTLSKCDITIAGPLGDDWTYENVARWTTYNGGIFCNIVDKDVTHVLATPEQYKARIPTIKLAIKYKAHIVTKDWFEDSLYKKRRCKFLNRLLSQWIIILAYGSYLLL